MGLVTSNLANVQEFDGYLLEYTGETGFNDTISQTLDENFFEMSKELGEDKVYIKSFDEMHTRTLLDMFNLDRVPPTLLVLDEHPMKIIDESNQSKCIAFQFLQVEDSSEVTQVLRTILNHMREEEFMKSLTWEQRKKQLKDSLGKMLDISGIVVTIATPIM